MTERTEPDPSALVAAARDLLGVDHPAIMATTVCSIVEHGGELLMVRQLNREGEERWNFPTGWMAPIDEDGYVQLPEHSVNRNLLMETGYAASDAHLIGVSVVREHGPDGHRVGTSLRLNYLSAHPRQTSYAVTDSDSGPGSIDGPPGQRGSLCRVPGDGERPTAPHSRFAHPDGLGLRPG